MGSQIAVRKKAINKGFPESKNYFKLHQNTSKSLESWLLFESYGALEEISSDGGPQFTSTEFQLFLKDWGVHRTSSAGYTQSNRHGELAVETFKRIIMDNTSSNNVLNNINTARAVLHYHNTPLSEAGLSPAQIVFHRQIRGSFTYKPKALHTS